MKLATSTSAQPGVKSPESGSGIGLGATVSKTEMGKQNGKGARVFAKMKRKLHLRLASAFTIARNAEMSLAST